MTKFLLCFLIITMYGCSRRPSDLKSGKWRGVLHLDEAHDISLPFHFNVEEPEKGRYRLTIFNAEERITVEKVIQTGDSISFMMPVFDSEIKAKITNKGLVGRWYNYAKGSDYTIPFNAEYQVANRFHQTLPADLDITGRWEVDFSKGDPEEYKAIGEFKQRGDIVIGTFLTETGDYRYLEGNITGRQLSLSCFDGAHAFLFTANVNPDGTMDGRFYSGTHWKESWVALRNENAQLRDPYSLTFMQSDYDKIAFAFPDLKDNMVTLSDEKYLDKIIILQLMGSWCPNCMDETIFLNKLYDQYKDDGLVIIGLAFEKSRDIDKAKRTVIRMRERLNVKYEHLIAGISDKDEASKSFPMLNKIMSYPTTIYLDRNKNVRKIYTGFLGPGTGAHHETHTQEITALVESLLLE